LRSARGERVVAQSAIVGSLFANALLVLGLVLIAGSLAPGARGVMRFDAKITRETATLVLGCLFIIVLVRHLALAGDPPGHHVQTISVIAAALLLSVYLLWLCPTCAVEADRPIGGTLDSGRRCPAGRGWGRLGLRLGLVRRRAETGDPSAPHLTAFAGW